jgi:hypothetical protein
MQVFGYNLSDSGKIARIRGNYLTQTSPGKSNLYFAYSSRSNIEWGSGVVLYTSSIGIYSVYRVGDPVNNTIAGSPDDRPDREYYVSLFGQTSSTGNLFKVIKSGKYNVVPAENQDEEFHYWDSPFVVIEKNSSPVNDQPTKSFDSLLSEQNISNISPGFKLYQKSIDGMLEIPAIGGSFNIGNIFNTDGAFYDSPMKCRLVTMGNAENLSDFQNLYFTRNIVDGSYSKCFNLSQSLINKLLTGVTDLSETIYELCNDYGVTVINGLRYKSYVKISAVDYALIFEYATGAGSKNLVVTTENFSTFVGNNQNQLGIFVDSNLAEANVNANRVSPIDTALLNNSVFPESLTLGYSTQPAFADDSEFFKYILNEDFINHNKIPLAKISWISPIPAGDLTTPKIINGTTYYTAPYSSASPEYYNVQNILIEIDLGTDFTNNYDTRYDVRKTTKYEIFDGSGSIDLDSDKFKLREIAIYYKEGSSFVPIYYARCGVSISNNNNYTFQIII